MTHFKKTYALIIETDRSWSMINWTTSEESIIAFKQMLIKYCGCNFSKVKSSIHAGSLTITKDKTVFKPEERIVHSKTHKAMINWAIERQGKGHESERILSALPSPKTTASLTV